MKKNLTVYLGVSADIFHHGHINIIEKSLKYGNLIIGLLTDKAISEKKRVPMLNWKQRYKILTNIDKTNISHHIIEGGDHFFRDIYLDDVIDIIFE